jgi:hypothetical protein
MSVEKSKDLIRNRTRDLPACTNYATACPYVYIYIPCCKRLVSSDHQPFLDCGTHHQKHQTRTKLFTYSSIRWLYPSHLRMPQVSPSSRSMLINYFWHCERRNFQKIAHQICEVSFYSSIYIKCAFVIRIFHDSSRPGCLAILLRKIPFQSFFKKPRPVVPSTCSHCVSFS